MRDDVMTCLKMLKARGGALDLKAAEIIEAMNEAGEEVTEELATRVSALEEHLNSAHRDRAEMVREVSELGNARAVLADALERVAGFRTEHSAVDLAHILIAEWRGACVELCKIRDEKLASGGFKPRMLDVNGKRIPWIEYDMGATRELLRDAMGMDRRVEPLVDGELHTLASQMHRRFKTMEIEFRGAEQELSEVVGKLRFVARDSDDLTPFLAADAAAEEIKSLRCELAEYRIADEAARDELTRLVEKRIPLPPELDVGLWERLKMADAEITEPEEGTGG
jgi:hypothetical protein